MTEDNSLHALRELAARYMASVAPIVAEYLPINEAIELLKLGAVDHLMRERQLSVSAVATHLSMSLRWAYKYRTMLKQGAYQHLQRLPVRLEVLDFFRHRGSEGATMTECLRALEAQRSRIQPGELAELLAVYCGLGYLVTGDGRYRWRESPLFMDSTGVVTRAQAVAGLVGLIGKLIRLFVEGQAGGLKHVHITVTEEAARMLDAELEVALQELVKRAIQRSMEQDPLGLYTSSVSLEAVILTGFEKVKPK